MRARTLFEVIAGDAGPSAPPGGEDAWRQRLSIALETLNPRQALVIRERYLCEPRPTLAQLGAVFEVSDGRAWQIERRALEKLRHPSRRWFLLGQGHLTALPWSLCSCRRRSRAEPKPPVCHVGLDIRDRLLIAVQDLDISVRVSNCLEAVGVTLVADLVRKTETDLLRIRNFGRKSLREIRALLANLGLSLGMKVDGRARMKAQARWWRRADGGPALPGGKPPT